jgi:hypothetical protein
MKDYENAYHTTSGSIEANCPFCSSKAVVDPLKVGEYWIQDCRACAARTKFRNPIHTSKKENAVKIGLLVACALCLVFFLTQVLLTF